MDRASARICMDDHFRRNCRRQAKVVCGGQTVDEHSGLIASGKGVDDLSIVSHGRLFRQAIDPGNVVQPAVDAAKLACMNEALQDFVHRVTIAEIEEIEGCPYLRWISGGDPVGDELFEVSHVRYLYTLFGRPQLATVRSMYAFFGQTLLGCYEAKEPTIHGGLERSRKHFNFL